MNEYFRYLIQLAVFSLIAFGLHSAFHWVFEQGAYWQTAHYTLVQLYFVEVLLTAIVVMGLVLVKKTSIGNLGFAFLGLITLKAVANYFFIAPVLNHEVQDDVLKHNFLIVFFIFLAFDLYVAYQLLNPNEKKSQEQIKKVS